MRSFVNKTKITDKCSNRTAYRAWERLYSTTWVFFFFPPLPSFCEVARSDYSDSNSSQLHSIFESAVPPRVVIEIYFFFNDIVLDIEGKRICSRQYCRRAIDPPCSLNREFFYVQDWWMTLFATVSTPFPYDLLTLMLVMGLNFL